jgi:hypothetical protein
MCNFSQKFIHRVFGLFYCLLYCTRQEPKKRESLCPLPRAKRPFFMKGLSNNKIRNITYEEMRGEIRTLEGEVYTVRVRVVEPNALLTHSTDFRRFPKAFFSFHLVSRNFIAETFRLETSVKVALKSTLSKIPNLKLHS